MLMIPGYITHMESDRLSALTERKKENQIAMLWLKYMFVHRQVC